MLQSENRIGLKYLRTTARSCLGVLDSSEACLPTESASLLMALMCLAVKFSSSVTDSESVTVETEFQFTEFS